MASELFAARSDFASLGSSLASFQQNAMADQISNNAAIQNYNNVSAQLKAAVPSGFGDIAFGAYELLGQGKDLVGRLAKVREAVAAAPDAIKAALVKGGNQLGSRVNQAKSLVSDTTNTLQTTGDALRTTATEGAEQLQSLATSGVTQLRTAAPALEGGAIEISPNVFMTRSGRIAPPAPGAAPDIAPTETPFSLPLATKRPTTSTLADTLQPENVIQSGLREIDPEMSPLANLGSFRGPSLTGVDVPGVSSQAGDFLRGMTPESLITRPDEAILPVQSLQTEGGAALSNALGVSERVGGAAQEVVTNLASTAASTAARGATMATDLASAGTGAVTKAASTLQEAGGAAADIVKGAATDVAETALEASSAFLPVIGEVTAVALGGYQLYEGFKSLFEHPSIAAPVTVAMPTVANIGQTFQSGI
jgi:hypothetical protein